MINKPPGSGCHLAEEFQKALPIPEDAWEPPFGVFLNDLRFCMDQIPEDRGFYIVHYAPHISCTTPTYIGSTTNLRHRLKTLINQHERGGTSPFMRAFGQIPAHYWFIYWNEYDEGALMEEYLTNTAPWLLNCRGKHDVKRAQETADALLSFHERIGQPWFRPFGRRFGGSPPF